MSEGVSECLSEWMFEWVKEWVSEGVSECVSEWMFEWVNVWVSECVSEWMFEWVSVWVSECVSQWARKLNVITLAIQSKKKKCIRTHNNKIWKIQQKSHLVLVKIFLKLPTKTTNSRWNNNRKYQRNSSPQQQLETNNSSSKVIKCTTGRHSCHSNLRLPITTTTTEQLRTIFLNSGSFKFPRPMGCLGSLKRGMLPDHSSVNPQRVYCVYQHLDVTSTGLHAIVSHYS